MSTATIIPGSYVEDGVEYPEDDGLPMADNSVQFDWIQLLHQNLASLFAGNPSVVVIGNMLWYPVQGDNKTRRAPDVMVAFGRPKMDRGSYLQWRETGTAPQVAFEIMSPSNTAAEMDEKLAFYDRYGVEEYYVYYPETVEFSIWLREGGRLQLQHIGPGQIFVSPRMQIRFENHPAGLNVYRPDGKLFTTRVEADQELAVSEKGRLAAERAQIAAERARVAAERARVAAERARELDRMNLNAEIEALRQQLRQAGLEPSKPDFPST